METNVFNAKPGKLIVQRHQTPVGFKRAISMVRDAANAVAKFVVAIQSNQPPACALYRHRIRHAYRRFRKMPREPVDATATAHCAPHANSQDANLDLIWKMANVLNHVRPVHRR